jgi:hypothetical protein
VVSPGGEIDHVLSKADVDRVPDERALAPKAPAKAVELGGEGVVVVCMDPGGVQDGYGGQGGGRRWGGARVECRWHVDVFAVFEVRGFWGFLHI